MRSFLKIFLFLLLLTLSSESVFAQPIVWRQIIGGPYNEIGYNCIELRSGCYLMAGEKEILIPKTFFTIPKAYLVKFDKGGNILWEKIIGDSSYLTYSVSVIEDETGNIFLPYISEFNAHILKLDSLGNKLWDRDYSGQGIIGFRGLSFVDHFKKIVLLGLSKLQTSSITKIDTSGNVIWSRSFYDSIPSFYVYTSHNNSFLFLDNSYYITGARGIIGFILKTDTSGNVIWNKRYLPAKGIFSIASISENSFIGSGSVDVEGYLYCQKFDSSGSVSWSRNYRNEPLAFAMGYDRIIKTYNSNFALGHTSGYNFGRFMTIDSLGSILTSKFYYYPENFYISQYNINNTSDSGYIVAGSLDSNNFFRNNSERGDKQIDALIFKIDKYGNTVSIGNSNSTVVEKFDIKIYPNPYNLSFNVGFSTDKRSNVKISLYDISGRQVKIIENSILNSGKYLLNVYTPELSSGIYFLKTEYNGSSYAKKILLIK